MLNRVTVKLEKLVTIADFIEEKKQPTSNFGFNFLVFKEKQAESFCRSPQ